MNLQQAKALAIEEGNVKTIHDKNNQLLWGAVGYDVKYKGDTTQASYTGKNQFNKNATPNQSYGTNYEALDTGSKITLTSSMNFAYSNFFYNFEGHVGQTLTFSANATPSASNRPQISIGTCNSSGLSRVPKSTNYGAGLLTVSYTLEEGDQYIYVNLYASSSSSREIGDYVDYTNVQLEFSSIPTSYEPYVGGVASPNPSYPQTVNVVTGTQTITLSDGVISDDYTVDLGSLELCKIGTYQDYIYKSGDDWYLHKEIGKEIYNGSENWQYVSTSAYQFRHTISMALSPLAVDQNTPPLVFVNSYVAVSWNSGISDRPDYCVSNAGGNNVLAIRNADYASVDGFKAFLNSNNIVVYYPLGTQIDTQITDTALISQLNAIHQFLTRYGYNSSITGNLPLIINRTVLS